MQPNAVIDHIVQWLKAYAKQSKTKGFVVGISGGIDSAVTSSLCACSGLHTICVEMPIHQEASQIERASEHIAQLKSRFYNVSRKRINLTETFETFRASIPSVSDPEKNQLSLANTRARLRMAALYYLAGTHGYLVVGTGNKVEDFGVGFYTKYGDGGVDISPIADLLKSQVYAIGKALKVPTSIQNAAPTDGLFGDSRTDEDQLGASYTELEWAMKMKETGKKIDDFIGREREVFLIYSNLNTNNAHKMQPIPVCKIPVHLI